MKNSIIIIFLLFSFVFVACGKDCLEELTCDNSFLNDDYEKRNDINTLKGTWVSDKNNKDSLFINGDYIRTNIVTKQIYIEDTPTDVHVDYYYNLVNGELRLSQNDDFSKVLTAYLCVNYTLNNNKLWFGDYKVANRGNPVIKNTTFTRVN